MLNPAVVFALTVLVIEPLVLDDDEPEPPFFVNRLAYFFFRHEILLRGIVIVKIFITNYSSSFKRADNLL